MFRIDFGNLDNETDSVSDHDPAPSFVNRTPRLTVKFNVDFLQLTREPLSGLFARENLSPP